MASANNENWFVQFRGHSLGPISTDQLLSSIKLQELGLEDKIASSRDRSWRPLSDFPEFSAHVFSLPSERPQIYKALPPVETLLKKKRVKKLAVTKKSKTVPAIAPEPEAVATKIETKPLENALPERPVLEYPKVAMPQVEQLALLEIFRDWKKKSEPKAEPLLITPQARQEEISLKIDLRLNHKSIAVLLVALAAVTLGILFYPTKKTGDLESSRSPNPPSPTMQPSSPGDPIPALKAPTRPQRD